MPRARPLSEVEVLHLRVAAQALHRPARRPAAELVRQLAGVQAQVLSAAALALGARSSSLRAGAVAAARLESRSVVLCWSMRGTLHLVAAEDHAWIVPLTVRPHLANAHRRLAQEGVPPGQPERALGLIEKMLEREGPLTRAEIGERLQREGITVAGQAIAHLVWLAAASGKVCHGPEKAAKQCFVLVRDWLGEARTPGREAALAELATRYLAAHGPAEPADLGFWSGLGHSDVKWAWNAIRDRLVEVQTTRGPRWTLRSRARPADRQLVRLLPAFDEYLMGWKDRSWIASTAEWATVNRGGGWVHPVLLFDGRLVATWRAERTTRGSALRVAPFAGLAPAVLRGAEIEAQHIAAFLGTAIELTLDY